MTIPHLFVITGVNKGLGLVILKEALSRGFDIESVSRSSRSKELPDNVQFTKLDCSISLDAMNFWATLRSKYGEEVKVHLINNAGTYIKRSYVETDYSIIKKAIDDNFFAAVNMTRGLMRHFRNGTIINIISTAGMKGAIRTSSLALKTAYSASKAAEAFFFSALQDELGRTKYRITNVHPYTINTWSDELISNTIRPQELAKWLIETSLIEGSFMISDCVIVPFEE